MFSTSTGLLWVMNWWGGILQGVNSWSPFHHLCCPPVVDVGSTRRRVGVGTVSASRKRRTQPTMVKAAVPCRLSSSSEVRMPSLQLWINTFYVQALENQIWTSRCQNMTICFKYSKYFSASIYCNESRARRHARPLGWKYQWKITDTTLGQYLGLI